MPAPLEKAWALLKFDEVDEWGRPILTDAEEEFRRTVEGWGTSPSPPQYLRDLRPRGWRSEDYGGLKQIALAGLPKGAQVNQISVAQNIDPTNPGPQEGRHKFHRGRKIPEQGPVLERGWEGEDLHPRESPPEMRRLEGSRYGEERELKDELAKLEGEREYVAESIKWMLDHSDIYEGEEMSIHGVGMEQWRRSLEEIDKEIPLARKKLEEYRKRFPEVPHYKVITAEHMARPVEPETQGSLFQRAWGVLKREEPIERDTLREVKRLRRDMGKLIRVKKRGKAEARP